ncbi:MAG: rRNA pseudouridine synthase [Oscillospiraceae bacterium]|nr:rRNA pseudouridine synthase [Oscillospiraceae bacterium]
MKERLQKIISASGICSRRAAEKLISEGKVLVNGIAAILGESADPETDEITVEGKLLTGRDKRTYIMLNKPRGFVTTLSDEEGRKTVAELVADCGRRVYPVGRLDMDSEGLLVFTDDGEFANALMHPKLEIKKTYETLVSGNAEKALPVLRSAMDIDGYIIHPATVEIIGREEGKTLLSVTIHEGRNRQVRKMCEKASLRVHRLKRVAEGPLLLGDLPLGKWRELNENEMKALRNVIFGGQIH